MHRRNILLLLFCLTVCPVFGQIKGNDIVGRWLTEGGKGAIEIYYERGRYYGKLVWLRQPKDEEGKPATDIKNPDKSLRTRKLLGILILDSFVYDEEEREWNQGKVYNPDMGHDATGIITLIEKDVLKVKGYVGFKWISKSETWTRTAKDTVKE